MKNKGEPANGITEKPAILENHLKISSINWMNSNGKTRRWEAVRRIMKNKETKIGAFDDIVVVVPVTEGKEIIFISQFRATVGAVLAKNEEFIDESNVQVIEFPAGVVDGKGKSKKETAMLELAEEAKYGARKWRIINEGPISAGISFEYVTTYLATGLYPVLNITGDEQSRITVYKVPLAGSQKWLEDRKKEGFVIDSRMIPLVSLVKEILRGE